MDGIKLAGAFLLAGSGIVGAKWLNRRASQTLFQIERQLAFLRYVNGQVACFSLPASAILARCDPTLLRDCGYTGEKVPRNFGEFFRGCRLRDEDVREILSDFCEEFGKHYREEQLRRCEYVMARLEERRAALASRLPTRKKLNNTLCISGTLAMILLFL